MHRREMLQSSFISDVTHDTLRAVSLGFIASDPQLCQLDQSRAAGLSSPALLCNREQQVWSTPTATTCTDDSAISLIATLDLQPQN